MKPIPIRVYAWSAEMPEVDAYPTPALGVVVVRTPDSVPCDKPCWTVTHQRSGLPLCRCVPSPETALAFAAAIADLADWMLNAAELAGVDLACAVDTVRLTVIGRKGNRWRSGPVTRFADMNTIAGGGSRG